MSAFEYDAPNLHQLLDGLNKEEAEAARQLLGISLFLGAPGLAVLRHFLDSLLLFGLGRLLVLFLERIGMPAREVESVHALSSWFELTLFASFAGFSLLDIFKARFGAHARRTGGEAS